MAKRGRKPKRRPLGISLNSEALFSIVALVLWGVGALCAVSLAYSNALFNKVVQDTLIELFGFGAFVVPVILLYLGLFFLRNLKWRILETRTLFGLLIFFVALLGILEMRGGLLGETVFLKVSLYISSFGAYLLFILLIVFSFVLMFEMSLERILVGATASFKAFWEQIKGCLNKVRIKREGAEQQQGEADKELGFEVVPTIGEPKETLTKEKIPSVASQQTTVPPAKTVSNLPYNDLVWEYPPISLLSEPPQIKAERGDVKQRASVIEKTLDSFGIKSRVVEVNKGPAVTQYAMETVQGTKITKITSLSNDLALALASPTGSVRIEAPIPGRSLIGIEVPNNSSELVTLKEIMLSDKMAKAKSKLTIALGKDVSGTPIIYDISKMPHVLVAGATGSGKSVMLHSMIATLLFRCSPAECKFIMVDPKRVELVGYKDIPHLLTPVIVDAHKALPAFKWAISEMERRYKLFENAKVRDIDLYNELSGFQALPYIIIIVDELADLMMTAAADTEKAVCRIAQLARAVGIHLILATQRPSVDVLTGLIKANVPCRVAFNVTSQIDSRVIIDQPGADKLLGRGDMLFVPPDASKPSRIQGVFVSDKERTALVEFLRQSQVSPDYAEDVVEFHQTNKVDSISESSDAYFKEAIRLVCLHNKASSSLLQRKLSIGYARAARLLDELEAQGIVSSATGSKPREVLIADAEEYLASSGKTS
ncbi:DNA translocase FtsK [Candidatus Parcubacteria bacterium]|nr:DNA translocase FtsK [Patescibacteria group bacterium]MCG2689078.1 DNA translocase FtsK [Candidatus Parcubacteria bacterium]